MSAHIGHSLPLEGSAVGGRPTYLGKRAEILEVLRLTTTRGHSDRDLAAVGVPANGGKRFKQLPMATNRSRECSRRLPVIKEHAMRATQPWHPGDRPVRPAPKPGRPDSSPPLSHPPTSSQLA